MRVETIAFAVTYRCNLACAHCSVGSSPEREPDFLRADQMNAWVDRALELGALRGVRFTGGEPTLVLDEVVGAIRHAHGRGLHTRMVTNGLWASSDARAGRVVARLREAGLDELALSITPYHGSRERFEDCTRAARAWLSSGGALQIALTGDRVLTDRVAVEICDWAREHGVTELRVAGDDVVTAGRGELLPAETLTRKRLADMPREGCESVLRPLLIDAKGIAYACAGHAYAWARELSLGDVQLPEQLRQALERANRDPLLRWLASQGPRAILETIDRERWHERASIDSAHPCQACTALFGDPVTRAKLHAYLSTRGDAVLFEECRDERRD